MFENPQEISSREATIDRLWGELDSLSTSRKQSLNAALATEIRKEDLRLEFADQAGDFSRFVNETMLSVGSVEEQKTLCGSTLEEVVTYGQQIVSEDASITTALENKKKAFHGVAQQLESLSCKDNPYTDLDVAGLEAMSNKLQ